MLEDQVREVRVLTYTTFQISFLGQLSIVILQRSDKQQATHKLVVEERKQIRKCKQKRKTNKVEAKNNDTIE